MRTPRMTRPWARGFTLIEMIIVIVVVGAIFTIGAMVMGKAFQSFDLTQRTTDVDWQGRVALERMVRELREIRTATAGDVDISSSTQLWFIDRSGNGVCFYLDGATGRLMRSAAASSVACSAVASSPQPLADNVAANGLSFSYFTNAGVATATASQLSYVTFSLSVTDDQISETFRVTVKPRIF